jgi:hypothetical protein
MHLRKNSLHTALSKKEQCSFMMTANSMTSLEYSEVLYIPFPTAVTYNRAIVVDKNWYLDQPLFFIRTRQLSTTLRLFPPADQSSDAMKEGKAVRKERTL